MCEASLSERNQQREESAEGEAGRYRGRPSTIRQLPEEEVTHEVPS